jgi:hypothetical protein
MLDQPLPDDGAIADDSGEDSLRDPRLDLLARRATPSRLAVPPA